MKLLPIGTTEKYKVEICFLNLIIFSYLFRTSIPLLKYPFLLLYISFIIYCLIYYKKRIVDTLIEFVRNYYLTLVLALILVISFLFSNKLYLTIFKDVVNMVILLSIFIISTLIVSGKKELNFFVSNQVYLIVLFAFVISVLGVLDFLNIFSFNDFSPINEITGNSANAPIYLDNNFALLPVFFGIISIFYFLKKNNSKLRIFYFNVLLFIFSLNILSSGSRRGFLTLIAILVFLLIAQIFTFYKKNTFLRKVGSDTKYFLLSILLLVILTLYMAFKIDYANKVKMLELVGCKNVPVTKQKIAQQMFKYTLFFENNSSYLDFYYRIWPIIPGDPDSGWGTRVHKIIVPLTGKNVEIVPNGAKGYLMDSTCNASYYPGLDLSESYTCFVYLNAIKGDRYKASVYCFVSDSFDGNSASFGIGSLYISKNIVSGKVVSDYDLESKGVWQKLEVEFVCNSNEKYVPVLISFCKRGIKDFSKLKGYVIFAYPTYENINDITKGLSLNITRSKGNHTASGIINSDTDKGGRKCSESLIILKKNNYKNSSEISVYDTVSRYKKSTFLSSASNKQNYFYSSILCFPLTILNELGAIQNDSDPIRNWASKFISEDTTYYPYKSNIVLDTISNAFIGDRVSRWEFALKIFSKEYNWKQKLFGGGFNFLNWYGYYFDKDKTRSDWPHNPFLSILLYSGMFGLLVYCFFLFKVFYYYLKYINEYPILFIFFLITFFFSFFSASSPFDHPIMGFFVILPFFIHGIYKKDKTATDGYSNSRVLND